MKIAKAESPRRIETPIAFHLTEESHRWIEQTRIDGPCSIYDAWTYGRILIEPTWRTYREAGVEKRFLAKDSRTY